MVKGRTAIRAVLIDDDRLVCDEVRRLLLPRSDAKLVGVFHDAPSGLRGLVDDKLACEVALVDLGLPGMSGIEVVRRLASARPEVDCLVFSASADDDDVFEALQAGASGYLLKGTDGQKLLDSIIEVAAGGAPMSPAIARRVLGRLRDSRPPPKEPEAHLTPRETEVLEMLARGLTYALIARALGIGAGTVQSHIKTIYRKLEINSKAEAAAEAFRRRLI
jgi:DNA-binding NarL/FixJ family response regulator